MKFKIGDIVRRINTANGNFIVGGEYIVTGIWPETAGDGSALYMLNNDSFRRHAGSNLELVTAAPALNNAPVLNNNKPPMEYLVQLRGLDDVSFVFGYGAKKHGSAFSFRNIQENQRIELLGKALRHMTSFAQGEKLDSETNKSHLAHAIADLMMALDLEKGDSK